MIRPLFLPDPGLSCAGRSVLLHAALVEVPTGAGVGAWRAACSLSDRRRTNGPDGRHVAGCVVARSVVAVGLGTVPASVRLAWTDSGRPFAVEPAFTAVSIAHAGSWAGAASVTQRGCQIGMDIVPTDQIRRTDDRTGGGLQRRLVSGTDRLPAVPTGHCAAVALALKEAAIKAFGLARGSGSWHDLRCRTSPADDTTRWSIGVVTWVPDGRSCSVALWWTPGRVVAVGITETSAS